MKYYILYNPLAGNGACRAQVDALSGRLDGETVLGVTEYHATARVAVEAANMN